MNYYGYIYKTKNTINGKIYIGQNKGNFNSNYFGSGKILKNAIKKEGKNNFIIKILLFVNTKYDLDKYEIKIIEYYRKLGFDLYNIAEGGQNRPYLFQTGRTHFKQGNIPWNKGQHIQTNTGRTHLKEGHLFGKRYVKGQKSTFLGKKHTSEAIRKMSKTWFKKGVSPSKEIILKREKTKTLKFKEKLWNAKRS
jgi:hypothetical protein